MADDIKTVVQVESTDSESLQRVDTEESTINEFKMNDVDMNSESQPVSGSEKQDMEPVEENNTNIYDNEADTINLNEDKDETTSVPVCDQNSDLIGVKIQEIKEKNLSNTSEEIAEDCEENQNANNDNIDVVEASRVQCDREPESNEEPLINEDNIRLNSDANETDDTNDVDENVLLSEVGEKAQEVFEKSTEADVKIVEQIYENESNDSPSLEADDISENRIYVVEGNVEESNVGREDVNEESSTESQRDESFHITENSMVDTSDLIITSTSNDSHDGDVSMGTDNVAEQRVENAEIIEDKLEIDEVKDKNRGINKNVDDSISEMSTGNIHDDSTMDVQTANSTTPSHGSYDQQMTIKEELDDVVEIKSEKMDTSPKSVKTEMDNKDGTSDTLDEPRRLRKNRNPVARYGYDTSSIKDELIDLDEFEEDFVEVNKGIEPPKAKKPIKGPKAAKIEPHQTRGRSTSQVIDKPTQVCLVCKKFGKCKFNIVRNGDVRHLCDDKCFREFRTAPTSYLKAGKAAVPATKPTAVKPVTKPAAKDAILTCSVCQVMNINAKKPFISWNEMDMCSEDCLSKFKVNLGTCCAHCGSHITLSQRGNTTLKLGTELKQFCNNTCLSEHRKHMKTCSTCDKDLAGNPDAFVAPIGTMNEFKDFCSPECLSRYDSAPKSVTVSNVDQRVVQPCAVCAKVKSAKHTVDLDKKKHYMCSTPCLSAFQYANKLSTSCDNCGAKCYTDHTPPQFIQFEGFQKRFCCTNCVNVFRAKNKKLKPCTWCLSKKINFDMIERVDANNEYQLFCSLNCLSLYRVNLQATSNQIVTCDHCKKVTPAQYHLTMSDASVRNFCSYLCVMTFQSAFNATTASGTVPQKGSMMANKQSTPIANMAPAQRANAKNESTMPVISNVMSLAPAKSGKQTVTVKGLAGSMPPIINKKVAPITAYSQHPVQVTRQIIVQPAPPKEYCNKAIICRPFVQTKATSCRPHNVTVATQTDKDMLPSAFIPVPVPIFIPVPMAMYSVPTPIALPIPVPVVIPCFLPTTKKTTAGIARRIKEILEKIPNDPLEAELLMMAEAVSTDKADGNDEDDDEDDEEYEEPPKNKAASTAQPEQMSEDMLQMALRMATEMSGNVTDIEAHLSQKAIEPVAAPIAYNDPGEQTSPAAKGDNRKRTRSMGTTRRNTRRSKRSRVDDSPPHEGMPEEAGPPPQQVSPDAEYHLKFMYGVNAWKHWVIMKNQQISQLPRLQGQKIRFFKTDLLQCTADEINYSLCLFVKEVCKPNGDKYAADSIYYLCLGVQQYLHENGRIDNIFMDIFYERFTDCLNDVVAQYEPTINAAGQLVCRIEEEHLWECKQLGAHSPQVLLNTLVYFNSKYFMLFTSEDHINLSFSHIMKHWKKTNSANGTPGRCVYLRYQQPMAKLNPDTVKKKHTPVYYEQCENIDNPLRCPVKLYEFYLSKCPDSIKTRNDVFYLVPERSCVPDSPVWYSTSALGGDAMQKMLNRTRLIKEIQEVQLSV